jgi:hypothetical protein
MTTMFPGDAKQCVVIVSDIEQVNSILLACEKPA